MPIPEPILTKLIADIQRFGKVLEDFDTKWNNEEMEKLFEQASPEQKERLESELEKINDLIKRM